MTYRKDSVRRKRFRNRDSEYLSKSQKKSRTLGRAIVIAAASVTFAALILILTAAYGKIAAKKNEARLASVAEAEREEFLRRESEEEARRIAEYLSEDERREKEKSEFIAHVHATDPGVEFAVFSGEPTVKKTGDELLDRAYTLAAGYEYDRAIALIESVTGYGNKENYRNALSLFQAERNALKPWKIQNNITHIFFHSLIVDPTITFDESITTYKLGDYNSAMTTVTEFVRMMEEMYEKGFVLVDIYDVVKFETSSDGTQKMTYQKIYLPEGKTPFLLSIDDTNYYEYMTGHGFATKLVLDENGNVTNEYALRDGTVVRGSFDVIPILEEFIEFHPDFSYRGARGMAGITGYNGVLGYRTSDYWYTDGCPYYEATEANERYKREEILSGPNLKIEEDKAEAKAVADAIKAMGWRFASHTWGHYRLGQIPMEKLVWDTEMWKREVEPILGPTDLLIFPYGNDIGTNGSWREYTYFGYNERYETLKSYGFDYYFNVDSSPYFMQRTDGYFRQGRRNLDGERMWQAIRADEGDDTTKNRLSDLFDDVSRIVDPERPRPAK